MSVVSPVPIHVRLGFRCFAQAWTERRYEPITADT